MKISFLASHGGSAAKQIISSIRGNELAAEVGIVITNNHDSDIYRWCQENKVNVYHISGRTHPNEEDKDKAILKVLTDTDTDLVVLSGYMKKIGPLALKEYSNRILNIHPSLLPRFGGKGFYGDRVHAAVIESGDAQSGATVQFINEEYDEGPMICQKAVDVEIGETVASLKRKVQAIEGELYIDAIQNIISDTG